MSMCKLFDLIIKVMFYWYLLKVYDIAKKNN